MRRKTSLQALDRRSAAGRHVDEVEGRLIDFVGGEPDEAQREIIRRAAMLSLQISQMDKVIAEGGNWGEDDPEHYLAFTRAYCEILQLLPRREPEVV